MLPQDVNLSDIKKKEARPHSTRGKNVLLAKLHFGDGIPRVFKVAAVHSCIEDALTARHGHDWKSNWLTRYD